MCLFIWLFICILPNKMIIVSILFWWILQVVSVNYQTWAGIGSCEFVAFNRKCRWHGTLWPCSWHPKGWGGGSLMGLSHQPGRYVLSSVQFSRSIMSDSLWPHGLQHARPPCPSPTPGVTQTHVHWVGDTIQPSHPLLSPSPPAFNLFSIRVLLN